MFDIAEKALIMKITIIWLKKIELQKHCIQDNNKTNKTKYLKRQHLDIEASMYQSYGAIYNTAKSLIGSVTLMSVSWTVCQSIGPYSRSLFLR